MDAVTIILAAALVAVGLVFAARAGRRDHALSAAGFRAAGEVWVHEQGGYRIEARADRSVQVALAPRPLAYERMARALGRGELLAELYAFEARAHEDGLEGKIPATRGRGVVLALERLVGLCADLEALPVAEAMSRHYLELGEGVDPAAELERLLRLFPDAPETLAVCRHELEVRRHPALVALAEAHLARAV